MYSFNLQRVAKYFSDLKKITPVLFVDLDFLKHPFPFFAQFAEKPVSVLAPVQKRLPFQNKNPYFHAFFFHHKKKSVNMRTSFKFSLLLFSLTLLLFGCRSEPDTDTQTQTAFKHAGSKTVYMSLPTQIKTLNPVLHSTPYAEIVYGTAVQQVMTYDAKAGKILPVLAKAGPVTEDITEGPYAGGAQYTYEIKDEAVWADGSPVTGADVAFSVKTVFAPKVAAPVFPSYYGEFTEIKLYPENPKKFTIILAEKYMLGEELSGYINVLPEYIFDKDKVLRKYTLADLKDKEKSETLANNDPALVAYAERFSSPEFSRETLTGSGAYEFVEWETGQRIVMARKKDWWGDKYKGQNKFMTANPDTIFFRIITDQTAMAAAVKNEDVDVAFGLNTQDFLEMKESERLQELYNFYSPPAYTYYFTYFNTKSPILKDKRVRRALAHLVDQDAVTDNLFDGMATKRTGPISDKKSYYNEDLKPIAYNPEKAKELLTEAGWTDSDNDGILDKTIDGKKSDLTLNYVSSETKFAKGLAAYYEENFKQAGIKLDIEILEFQATRQRQSKREFDLASGALGGSPLSEDFFQIYHTSVDTPAGMNRSGFGNAESDALIEKIRKTLTAEDRAPLYKKFQEIMYEEQPKLFLLSPNERIVISKRLKGFASGFKPYVHVPSLEFAEE